MLFNNQNNLFLFYLLINYKSFVESEEIGSIFKAINKAKLKKFPIPLPSIHEQEKIASILSDIDENIEVAEKKKEILNELFKSLLKN